MDNNQKSDILAKKFIRKTDIVYPGGDGEFRYDLKPATTLESVVEIFHAAGGRLERVFPHGGEYDISSRKKGYFIPIDHTLTQRQRSALEKTGAFILTVPGYR